VGWVSGIALTLPAPSSSTTAEIGFDVGLLVASTLPGIALRFVTSLVALALFVATLLGTGFAAVGFTVAAVCGAGTSADVTSCRLELVFPVA
jgi:hypothetical protein